MPPEPVNRIAELESALESLEFVVRGESHFGACGARWTDHCTTPRKCELAREALYGQPSSANRCPICLTSYKPCPIHHNESL
jgi:hypothetical protein